MELEHSFVVQASVDTVWGAFGDLNRVGGCLPGATITSVDGDDFTGTVKVKLGPISLLYTGTGHYAERDEAARRVVIEAKGKDKRGNGTASATITAQLAPSGDGGGTDVAVTTDLSITGKPAQFGRGVIQDVSDKLLGQFVDCLQGKLAGGSQTPIQEAAAAAEGAAAAEAVAAAEAGAAGVIPPPGDARNSDDAESRPEPGAATNGWVRPGVATAGTSPPTIGHTPATEPVSGPEPEIDLMSTVGPVLAKRVGPVLLAALGGIVVAMLLRRRSRVRRCRAGAVDQDG